MSIYVIISLILFQICVNKICADISHLYQYYHPHYPQEYLYETYFTTTTIPPPPLQSPAFQLPEIIVNRKASDNNNGYHYPKPVNTYIPVTNEPSDHYIPLPTSTPSPSQPSPPDFFPEIPEQNFPEPSPVPTLPPITPPIDQTFQPPVPSPPSEGYLPPPSNIIEAHPIEIISDDSISIEGYNYQPATSTIGPFGPGSNIPLGPSSPSPTNGYNYQPPVSYLPPTPDTRSLKDFNSIKRLKPIQLRLNEMRCLSSNQDGYFRAILTTESNLKSLPIIDDSSSLISDNGHCDIHLIKSKIIIDIHSENFQKCNVKYCGGNSVNTNNNNINGGSNNGNNGHNKEQNLCLRLRFPMISGMKTASDSILTLQCKLQEKIVTRTHSLKIGVSNELLVL